MKVVELTAYHAHIPLRKPIRHASHTREATENLIVRCVLEDGTEGFGEGVPREYVTGETIDSAISLLKQSQLEKQFQDCPDFSGGPDSNPGFLQAVTFVENLRLAPVENDERECQGNAARCALELALLDAYGKRFQKPLSHVTDLLTPELYKPQQKVQYSGAITSTKGLKLRLAAWKYWVFGFQQMKVKVGIEGQEDRARLQVLRSRMGKKIDFRIDANEAWHRDNVVAKIQELQDLGITSVEQPVLHEEVDCLTEVRSQVKVLIMLDESLCSMIDAKRAAEKGLCDLFNLRLSKCGGFIPSLRLAQFAHQNGLRYQLGCQVGETAILSAAGRHFACSVANIRFLEGSYDKHLVHESLGKEDITFGWGGWAPALTGNGLGIEIDPEALQRVTQRKESLLGQ